jgi:hypothetical protein
MFTGLTSRFFFTSLIISFILHNLEEAISICSYPVQSPVSFITPASCSQFLWAVSIITMAGITAYIFAMRTNKTAIYLFISTTLSVTLLFNVFVPHVLVAIYTLQYTPGLASAILLNLPLSVSTLKLNKSDYTTITKYHQHILLGLVSGYLLFALIMRLVLTLA